MTWLTIGNPASIAFLLMLLSPTTYAIREGSIFAIVLTVSVGAIWIGAWVAYGCTLSSGYRRPEKWASRVPGMLNSPVVGVRMLAALIIARTYACSPEKGLALFPKEVVKLAICDHFMTRQVLFGPNTDDLAFAAETSEVSMPRETWQRMTARLVWQSGHSVPSIQKSRADLQMRTNLSLGVLPLLGLMAIGWMIWQDHPASSVLFSLSTVWWMVFLLNAASLLEYSLSPVEDWKSGMLPHHFWNLNQRSALLQGFLSCEIEELSHMPEEGWRFFLGNSDFHEYASKAIIRMGEDGPYWLMAELPETNHFRRAVYLLNTLDAHKTS